MRKLVMTLLMLVSLVNAGDNGSLLVNVGSNEKDASNRMIGKEMYSVYVLRNGHNLFKEGKVDMGKVIRNNICNNANLKDLIDMGIILNFIYVSKDGSSMRILHVAECD